MNKIYCVPDYDGQTSIDDEDDKSNTMKTEMQTNAAHHRVNGKVVTANASMPPNSTIAQQKKDAEYKRLTENTMSVCNVNLMENSLASR